MMIIIIHTYMSYIHTHIGPTYIRYTLTCIHTFILTYIYTYVFSRTSMNIYKYICALRRLHIIHVVYLYVYAWRIAVVTHRHVDSGSPSDYSVRCKQNKMMMKVDFSDLHITNNLHAILCALLSVHYKLY